MSELAATILEALGALHAGDPSRRRFGAAAHRYALAPPIRLDRPELPPDLAEFVGTVGAAGAGPGYGFLGAGDLVESRPWGRGVVVAHLGCGYAAVVSLATGEVWLDAQAIGVVKPIAASFTAWYLGWLEHLARNALPDPHVPAGACPLPNALSGFLGIHERRHGLAAGTLEGTLLREALGELGPQSIEIAAESSLVAPNGTRVAPCLACACLVENLREAGLRGDVIRLP